MLYNYKLLRNRIKQKGYTIRTLSEATGIAPNVLRMKLYSWKQFSMNEILNIAQILNLSKYEIEEYFFTTVFHY